MEKLLNADGTPSFLTISDLRTNFEESFAKKQLGTAMKDVVVKSINSIENKKAENIFDDENARNIISNSVREIADKAYTNMELNGSSYLGGIKKIVVEYAGMEAQHREDIANAILSTESDKSVAGDKIMKLFSTENLKFSSEELQRNFIDDINAGFGSEGENIVTEIGSEVGAAIAEAEEKNIIINETSKIIQDEKDKIREELATIDEDEEDDEKNENIENEFDDSEDLGEEPNVEDNGDINDDDDIENETSEEDFDNFGLEALEPEIAESVYKTISSDIPKLEKELNSIYEKSAEKLEAIVSSKGVELNYKQHGTKEEFKNHVSTQLGNYLKSVKAGTCNKKKKLEFILGSYVGDPRIAQRVIGIICICMLGWITTPLGIIFVATSGDRNKKIIKGKEYEMKTYKCIDFKFKKIKGSKRYNIICVIRFNINKILKAQGIEDYEIQDNLEKYDNEVVIIEDRLNGNLMSDIENGKISIGTPNITDNDIINVNEHTEDEIVGYETPDVVPEVTVTDGSDMPDQIVDDTQTVDVGCEEYRMNLYSNLNIAKTVIPLSPTRLDSLEIPHSKSLGTVFAKSTESLDSLRSVINSRLDILEDIVGREEDDELTTKFNDYKACALEALNDAENIQNTFNSIGITPSGLIDTDPVSTYIAGKSYKYLNGNLKMKSKDGAKSFESLKDAVDDAFDIIILKDAARKAKNNDELAEINKLRASREDLFWNNILDLTDDENKDKIKNILKFGDLDIDSKALVDDVYLENLKIALDTNKVFAPGKSESEINEEIFNKSKERIESFLGKDINMDQCDIIRAMIEERDTSIFAPTPFEKFIIKFGTDKAVEKDGGKDFEVGQESAEEIKNAAIVSCVLDKIVDKLAPMNKEDTKAFKEYIGA